MTTEDRTPDAEAEARKLRLNDNLAKVEDLSKRLTAALTSRRKADPALAGPAPDVYMKAAAAYLAEMMQNPARVVEHQVNYWGKTLKHYVEAQQVLAKGEFKAPSDPGPKDRRFANPLWESHPFFNYLKQQYQLNSERRGILAARRDGAGGTDAAKHAQADAGERGDEGDERATMAGRHAAGSPGRMRAANDPKNRAGRVGRGGGGRGLRRRRVYQSRPARATGGWPTCGRRAQAGRLRCSAPVAQLDRATASEAVGHRFESYRAHHSHPPLRYPAAMDAPELAGVTRRPDRLGTMFSAISWRYDLLNTLMSLGQDARWRTILAAGVPPGARVLDLCCGSARSSLPAYARSGRTVTGLDVSFAMLERGRAFARERAAGFDPVHGDGFRLPFRDGTFDVVTAAFGLRNLVPLPAAAREIQRVLAPGGAFLALDSVAPAGAFAPFHGFYLRHVVPLLGRLSPDPEAYRYLSASIFDFGPPDVVARRLEDAGFERVTARPLMLGGTSAAPWGS